MFDAAIASAQPAVCIPPHLPAAPSGRLIVIGAGKASAAMARAVEDHWSGPLSGLVVTRYGYAVPCKHVEIIEAAHPVPDASGMRAAQRMLELVGHLREDDLVLCLISGGGSALLPLPAPGFLGPCPFAIAELAAAVDPPTPESPGPPSPSACANPVAAANASRAVIVRIEGCMFIPGWCRRRAMRTGRPGGKPGAPRSTRL